MKLHSEKEVKEFIKVIEQCENAVYVVTPAGETVNLKTELYMGLGLLTGRNGDLMEVFAQSKADEWKMIDFLFRRDNGIESVA